MTIWKQIGKRRALLEEEEEFGNQESLLLLLLVFQFSVLQKIATKYNFVLHCRWVLPLCFVVCDLLSTTLLRKKSKLSEIRLCQHNMTFTNIFFNPFGIQHGNRESLLRRFYVKGILIEQQHYHYYDGGTLFFDQNMVLYYLMGYSSRMIHDIRLLSIDLQIKSEVHVVVEVQVISEVAYFLKKIACFPLDFSFETRSARVIILLFVP